MDITSAYNIVDTETTGLHPLRDRIIEIAILRVENNKIVKEYNTLINPLIRINDHITKITGITQEQVNNAPLFEDIRQEIRQLLEGELFVAHNARFDHAFVKNEFSRFDERIKLKTLCTVRLSRSLFPDLKSHSLESLIRNFDIKTHKRHRALDDTKAVFDFLKIAQEIKGKENVDNEFSKIKKKPSIPRYLKNNDLEELPESPGVYIFWADDIALYVGKSVNLKDRIRSHFTSDHNTSKDLKISSQIKRIETITTAGELGALLLESKLIKKLFPLFNKQLRREKTIVAAMKDVHHDGYFQIKLHKGQIDIQDHEQVMSTYRSIRKAKDDLYLLANEYGLCLKLLDLEKTNGKCFNYQLGKCSGACGLEESPLKYNIKFIEAFGKRQIQKWPFESAVALIEENAEKRESHIINNWSYLGTISSNNHEQPELYQHNFDLDTYNIIKKFIFGKKGKVRIVPIKEKIEPAEITDLFAGY